MRNNKVFTVSDINKYIKALIDMDYILNNIWVQGEISNFKRHTSGHMYFTLKDQNSAISCIMFRSSVYSLNFEPKNGIHVMVQGAVSVYERSGQYQIYVNKMEREGIGALYEAFEKLKKDLEAEGLFEKEHKRPIPPFPRCIGIVTSPTGAAIKDIIQISKRRNPNIDLVIYPVLVQGEEAPKSIAEAIKAMNEWGQADVLIVGRGGGSIEDLWAFNEEVVARAIYESKIPIISAVGHETDFTIADFVADLRAPTPSAAAELAVPSRIEYISKVSNIVRSLNQLIDRRISLYSNRLLGMQNRVIFKKPMELIYRRQQDLDDLEQALHKNINNKLRTYKTHLIHTINTLETLSPLNTLTRGYSIIMDHHGQTISSVKDVKINEDVNIRVKDGFIQACVKGTRKEVEKDNA
ncbi:exodeoxyribonuclease VII large subunit [Defluviitalea raffinosedens]|jgi:exodeoxyribonuclease VII large subunit|uniref:Exodeoxyribonuclease 7 large subunit n=1 Tax=Defluviitalea raffinosedens TaxID=1450156 RepID=A0A7C8LUV5_9FIRM|nr:exodeoxyribonuclease VII large subunit [Defluviitalea raffinosedens]KAE9637226.1 exodeoxyribonuclease VII large subunit [Defluviitalea raffinosedens]MBM7685527.1 exodeoxyribonuclease VII large subunit [Defluviitalea raffinosedens]MBZ4668541.1 xseA [Defluviitaleaceae bacterium]HHW66744.1 exodeoxyribonuclease VII large subunit [Candidatus Epulonipiscium sp.]